MKQYLDLLADVIHTGKARETRSGTTISVFKRDFEHDMRTGFPVPTTKHFAFNAMVGEALWFLNGLTDLPSLRRFSCLEPKAWTIWTNDCKRWHAGLEREFESEDCGLLYGHQWRNLDGMDQIANLIADMMHNPTSRYMLVQSYNPVTRHRDESCLPACHTGFQVYVDGEFFDLDWTQRSVDVGLGLPFNVASYALVMKVLEKITGLTPRFLSGSLKDVHVYKDHLPGLKEQLLREPHTLPEIVMPEISSLADLKTLTASDFSLTEYEPHKPIKMPLSVG